jgi:hypothetical protein
MTEERSVTFTAADVRDALILWAWYKSVPVAHNARLTLVPHGDDRPATATLTWSAK